MKNLKTAAGIVFVFCTVYTAYSQDTLHLRSDKLDMVIANNQSYGELHRAGYSGVSELYLRGDSGKNMFVPFFSGLNLEFIFSGDSASYDWDIFEPRKSPMQLTRLAPDKVRLKQHRTDHWPLESTISYSLSGNLVEMHYKGVPLEDIWNKYNYIGLFFASYINMPGEKGIHFLVRTRAADTEHSRGKWIYHLPPGHGQTANHRPAGSSWDPSYDPGFPLSLVSGFSDFEYLYPFYFGRSGGNVIILMFRNLDENAELRFAQSPTGGGPDHPAWDFIYFKQGYELNKPFDFKVGMIVKKYEGKEDVIREYENWSGEKIRNRFIAD